MKFIKCQFEIEKEDGSFKKCGKVIPRTWGNRKYCEDHSIENMRRCWRKNNKKYRKNKENEGKRDSC